ncbi:MAG: hypothetical protein CMJ19_02185 [Phycisphaeraceae bacterium]|nr:hypothetical protein [Phycisphaeraceae bacterium]
MQQLSFQAVLYNVVVMPVMQAIFMSVANVCFVVYWLDPYIVFFSDEFLTGLLVFRYLLLPLLMTVRDMHRGMFLGKYLLGLEVIDNSTCKPINIVQSFKRNLWMFVPCFSFVLFWKIRSGYRLGDRWANTKVVFRRSQFKQFFLHDQFCTACRYDLTGNTTGQCPECGAVVPSHGQVNALSRG